MKRRLVAAPASAILHAAEILYGLVDPKTNEIPEDEECLRNFIGCAQACLELFDAHDVACNRPDLTNLILDVDRVLRAARSIHRTQKGKRK